MDQQAHAKQLIDRIVYLASLVSEPKSVDKTLDKLRVITATSQKLAAQEVKDLEAIEAELENHLIHKEKLRSFTKESLKENVERNFAQPDPQKGARKDALRRIILTVAVAVVITALLTGLRLMEGQVVLAFFIFTLFVGLALLFQSIKKDLVAQLRGSVSYLMAATIGTGLFALNFPVIALSKEWENMPLFQHGGFLIGAIPVYACYYLAFYIYAKQVGASIPKALRPVGVLLTALLVTLVSIVIPHPVAVPDEIFFDIALVGFAVSVYFSAVAAALAFMAVPKTTVKYSKPVLLLAISLILQTVGNGNFLVFVTYMSGDFSVNEQKGQILTAMLIIAALAFQYVAAYKSRTALR